MATNNIRYLYNSNTGIELIFCGNSTISYPTHNHISVLTIGIVLDGSIVLTADHEVKTYEKNQTFVICPYMPHSISAHNRYTLLSLCIDKNIAARYAADKIRNDIMTLLLNAFHKENINQYQILQLLDFLNLNAEPSPLAAYADWHSDSQNPMINNLKKQLELYPESKFSIEEMAQNAFISKYHFIRRFKAEVGLTPHQFQLQNRIRKAQRLMHKTETITEVALATGFCDQSHFIKQFRKQTGLSPLTYRLSYQTIEPEELRQYNAGINFANR
ncbi:MAG: AraC family transcriptional regulator [Lachnospiraceae bacterium]|nr:AraC family transcriptional regulator [Lachnospiraceae bacterium]